ncbi:hypothetical protein [Pedobacter soli]|uniref:Uncharacterized protein n=1 Tax=Pedobacter soli TaxID=390242 RepID=A0A1G6LV18_9SPHI|nr:hypothetical protein [Pedobacter soli]SDC46595.1 hypothetical protein SAMN04488024_102136 [Pedobacter soli]
METYVVHPDKVQEKALKAFLEALEVPYEIKKTTTYLSTSYQGLKKGRMILRRVKASL